MSTLTPEQATFILAATALPSLNAEHPVTKRVIAAIPAEKADFRPDNIVRSAIDLAWHIAAAETRFLDAVASGAFDFSGGARPESIRTPSRRRRLVLRTIREGRRPLEADDRRSVDRIIDFRGLFQLPAVVYVQVGLNHSIHHRGQLSMYLRPMGAKVPSIYGESYDAREAREKAKGASG